MLTIVVGSKGYLGSELTSSLEGVNLAFRGMVRKKIEYDSYEYLSTEIFKGLEGQTINIVYCALDSNKAYSLKNAERDIANITDFLFEIERKKMVIDKFIYLSSHAVYSGNKSTRCNINDLLITPDEPYSFMKILSEKLIINVCDYNGWKPVILRCGAILGKKSSGNFLSSFLKNQIAKKTSVLKNKKNKFNALVHVESLVQIIIKLLLCERRELDKIYNIGSSGFIEMEKICDIFSQVYGIHAKVDWHEDLGLKEKIFEYNNNGIFSLSRAEDTLKKFFMSEGG